MSSKRYCYIVSIKYAPGLWKEFRLLANNLKQYGYDVKYLISDKYAWMTDSTDSEDIIYVSTSKNAREMVHDTIQYPFLMRKRCHEAFSKASPAFLCIYNPHPLNFAILGLAREFNPNGLRTIYLHEPGKPNKSTYGLKGRIFFKIVEICQALSLSRATDIILPSPFAVELFNKYYPDYSGKTHYSPILIPDSPGKKDKKKRYFTMCGRFNFTKRLDDFIKVINHAAKNNVDLEFQIVTASPIDEYLKELTPVAFSKTKIINKSELSDTEISDALSESFAILCLHPMVIQSGVITVAFMNSTPVIARNSPGFTQFVKHEKNGLIVQDNFSSQELIEAMNTVKNNFTIFSSNARQTYLDLFAEKNWSKNYRWLTNQLKL